MDAIPKGVVICDWGSVRDQNHIERCIDFLRESASNAILCQGINTITQQNAALGIYEPERCEAIKNYIAACRNEYLRCKALILAATTNDEADAVQFIPPSVQENL